MTRIIRCKLLPVVLALCLLGLPLMLPVYAGGTLRLFSAADIKELLCNPENWGTGTTFLLANDIAVPDSAYEAGGLFEGGFVPIGTAEQPFCAVLVGNDHAITNIKIAASGMLDAGLVSFGMFAFLQDAAIRNLNLDASFNLACTFTACRLAVGGLAGFCTDSVVQNCGVALTLTGGFTGTAAGTFSEISAGAFFGEASGVNAFRCTAKLNCTGLSVFSGSVTLNLGAFAGSLSDSDFSDCLTSGSISPAEGMVYSVETSASLTLNAGGIAGLLGNTSLTSCRSDCTLNLSALADAASTDVLNMNGGGLVGFLTSGYIDKCEAAGDMTLCGRLLSGGTRALCGSGITGKIFVADSASAFLSACSFTGALTLHGRSPDGMPPIGATYTAAGGVSGFCGGTGTVTVADCGFFGTVSTDEQTPVTSAQTVYSGGIVGRAVTETASLGVTGCLSNGNQTAENGGYIYAGGILGYNYGNNLTLDTCLFSGNVGVKGEGAYFYGAGAVACTAAGTENPEGSVIRATLTDGSLSVTSESAALFKASFACMLRRTSVLSCCAAGVAQKAVISASLPVSPYEYTTDITAVQAANASTQDAYASLTATGGWSWSALFERPVFAVTAFGYAGALCAEPGADNPLKFPQTDQFYAKNVLVDCAAYTDIPSPYPTQRLTVFSSSDEKVAAIEDGKVRTVGIGRSVMTVLNRQYAADMTVVTTSFTFDIYVRSAALPGMVTAGAARYLTLFSANSDLFAAADACRSAFGSTPSLYVDSTLIAGGIQKGYPVYTGYTAAIFPESAGFGSEPYYLVMAGDCSGDGAVDWLDAWYAQSAAVNAYTFEDSAVGTAQKYAADVNADGVIDALDAMCIELCANGHTTILD